MLPPLVPAEVLSAPWLRSDFANLIRLMPVLEIRSGYYWERAASTRARILSRRLRARLADSLISQSRLDPERQELPPLCRICRVAARIAIPGIASGCARRRSPGRSSGTMCGTAIRVKALTRAAPRSGPPLNRPAGIFGRLGSRAVSQRRQHSAHRQRDAEAGCRVSFRALARALGTTSAAAQSGWEIPV